MVRNFNLNALEKLATDKGTEPLNFIEIQWQNGTLTRYGDKDLPGINGKILNMSDLEEIISLSTDDSAGSISVVLDDTDGEIKALMDQYVLHKRPCTVYQYFKGLDLSDACPILYGEVVSPIVWSEADRTVSFSVATKIYTNEVGFSVEEGQFEHVHPSLIGVVWPLAFGGVVHAPATKIASTITGTTMSLFGIPDPTLILKIKMLGYGIASLIKAYNLYVQYANAARAAIPMPLTTQYNYIEAIVDEDTAKQEREDLIYDTEKMNAQVETVLETYFEASDDIDEQELIKIQLDAIKADRDKLLKQVKDLSHELADLEYTKKALEIDAENEKYVYGVIGSIRDKLGSLLQDYRRLSTEYFQVINSALKQNQLLAPTVIIIGGEYFPQNIPIVIDFSGVKISGIMSYRTFTISDYLPTYSNVIVGPKLDDKVDTFYITDPNIRLENKYCQLNNGYIIKVTGQEGTKCTFETKARSKSKRGEKRAIQYSGQNASAINSGLSNILTGAESVDTINRIINTFPTDLSKSAWYKLIGDNNELRIKLVGTPTSGTWTITVDGVESDSLPFDATSEQVKTSLLALYPMTQPNTPNDWSVSGGPLDEETEIVITFTQRPLPVLRANCENLIAKYYLKLDGNPTGGTFAIATAGVNAGIFNHNATSAQLTSYFADSSSIWTFGSGTLPNGEIEIRMHDPNAVPYIATTNLSGGTDPKAKVYTPGGTKPFVTIYTHSTGAHEHTTQEIDKMLKNYVGKGEYGKQLKDAQQALNERITEYRETDWSNSDELLTWQKSYFKDVTEYWTLRKKADVPRNVLEKAYQVISKHEYQKLFELEIYHYLEWVRSMTPLDTIGDSESVYVNGYDVQGINEVSPIILSEWLSGIVAMSDNPNLELLFIDSVNALPQSSPWVSQVSSSCSLDGNNQEKYVCNILPSTITGVYGKRFDKGVETLVPIPYSYYTKNENDNYGLFNATTITLHRPLSEYKDDQWQDGLYVTFTSTVGPNTADIIDFIVTNYTNLAMDSTSYNHVKATIEKYPQNFVLYDKQNALELIKEIAWQARCMVDVKGTQVRLIYLAEEPTPIDTITEGDIIFGSLSLGYTETEDINTKHIASWRPSYNLEKPYKIILRHNITRFGTFTEQHDYFTYNIGELIYKSATFWMIRRCNTWKLVRFQTALNKLFLEVHDCVTLDLQTNHICNGPVNCLVNKAAYNSEANVIDFELWVPVRMGEMTPYQYFWPAGLSAQVIFPTPEDITSGFAGTGLDNSSTPSGTPYDPYDSTLINFRPKDYGSLKPGDDSDEIPANPAGEFVEVDYASVTVDSPDVNPAKDLSDSRDLEKDEPSLPDLGGNHSEEEFEFSQMACVSVGFGHIITFDTEASEAADDEDMPSQADPDVTIEHQFYKVRLSNGIEVSVRQRQIAKGERIPKGVCTAVFYDQNKKEYQMQVPVWIWSENIA